MKDDDSAAFLAALLLCTLPFGRRHVFGFNKTFVKIDVTSKAALQADLLQRNVGIQEKLFGRI